MSACHMQVGRKRLLFIGALLVPWLTALLPSGERVEAGSVNYGSNGNCNNWLPTGWSYTQWMSYPATSTGSTYGELDWYDGTEWTRQLWNTESGSGASADPTVDNNWPFNEEGTQTWREWGNHSGTMISNSPQYDTPTEIWCGGQEGG